MRVLGEGWKKTSPFTGMKGDVIAMQHSKSEPIQHITVSIVSHGHGASVERLILQTIEEPFVDKIILTLNLPEKLSVPDDKRIVVLQNTRVKGFGANHNAAFIHCSTSYFCVLNPDIVLLRGSIRELTRCLQTTQAAVAGPLVISPYGKEEDSWRRFPTLLSLSLKALGHDTTIFRQKNSRLPLFPDWVAGMCMLFDSKCYSEVMGFDERLFLYYEDVDICTRLWRTGQSVVATPNATVIHDAQRASRSNLDHMRWHAVSMVKYLWRYCFRLPSRNTLET